MYNGESFTHYTEKEGLFNNNIYCILRDSHDNLWIGSWYGGVSKFDGETFTHFSPKEGLSHGPVFTILEDSHGNFWFGTWGGGVSIYDGNTFTYLNRNQGLISDRVWSMEEDSHGNIWIGTDDGLNMFDGETLTKFTQKDGLADNHVRTIMEDSQGNVWFGTHGGVSMFNGETFTDFTQNEGLGANRVRSIMEDSRGNLWFGTEGGGVSIYYGKDFTHFTQKDGLSELQIIFMLEDSHGNLWFGTFEGLCKYDGETLTHFTVNEGLSSNDIAIGFEDSHGNLWFGTEDGGVSMYNGKYFTHFTQKEGLISNEINLILEDSQGNLWFSTRGGGVCMNNGDTFINFTEKEGLSNNWFKSIMEDSHGNLWFGTFGGGVSMYNGDTFTHFTEKDGLSDNYVKTIMEDNNNEIWIGTANGLNRIVLVPENDYSITRSKYSFKPVIYSYGLQDGLKGMYFSDHSALSDSKNRLWWGTDKGLTMLDLNNLKTPVEAPVMQLNRIDINGQLIDYRHLDENAGMKMEFDSVVRFYNYPLNLELPYNQNNLTFHFAAIDWSSSQKFQYSYVMDGLEDQWNGPTAEAYVEYRNMPYGMFTFKVRAIGAAQKWSDPFEYTFRILPPFWLTWWAYLIYSFILLLLIRWYRGFLIKREKIKADLKIKQVEVNKMQELDHMKSRFFANISHEFRTPLTLIQGPLEDIKNYLPEMPENIRASFQFMKRNTQRLQNLINQILDISKLETGKVKLQVSEGNLEQFIRPIILSFLSLAESKNIKYVYDMHVTSDIVFFDCDKVEKILTNLISNAFKFTPEGGKIRVSFEYIPSLVDNTPEYITIKVVDTGRGIPREELDRGFDRFYQVSDSDSRIAEGTGLGLALTKELVDLYRGEISVDSQEGKGSTFIAKLPVSINFFTDEERVLQPTIRERKPEQTEQIHDQKELEYIDVESGHIQETVENRPVILIVEDNVDLMNYLSQNLENHYHILSAINGTNNS